MFTGIVEEIGTLKNIRRGAHSAVLAIAAKTVLTDVHIGDSIAVNGVCLTVTDASADSFSADVMHETLNRSSLAGLQRGAHVNLERAMAVGSRFGGHIVAGHVDGVGTITDVRQDDNALWYTVSAAPAILRYIVEKGSVTIDGVSLTVTRVTAKDFAVSLIPHTAAVTILGEKKPGDSVNLENDIIGKYVEKLMQPAPEAAPSRITQEFLIRNGF